jgi:hypothetical protein
MRTTPKDAVVGHWNWVFGADITEANIHDKGLSTEARSALLEEMAGGKTRTEGETFRIASSGPPPLATVEPMSLWDEMRAVIALFIVLGSPVYLPLITLVLLFCANSLGWLPLLVWSALLLTSNIVFRKKLRKHWMRSDLMLLVMRYFSFRIVWGHKLHGSSPTA